MPKRRLLFDGGATPTSLLRLSITGIGKTDRKQFRHAIEWMLTALVGTRLVKNIDLTVRFVPHLGNYVGDCEWLDDNIGPRQFLIRISTRQTKNQRMVTLAHELTHVKQFVTNQLFDYAANSDLTRWRRKIIDVTQYAYRDLPWEKDAYATQGPLLCAYKKFVKEQEQE
jgi:hypothetical protein